MVSSHKVYGYKAKFITQHVKHINDIMHIYGETHVPTCVYIRVSAEQHITFKTCVNPVWQTPKLYRNIKQQDICTAMLIFMCNVLNINLHLGYKVQKRIVK